VHRLLDRGLDKDAHNFVQQVTVELSTDPADVLFDVRSYSKRSTKAQGACIDKQTKAKSWRKKFFVIGEHRLWQFPAPTNSYRKNKEISALRRVKYHALRYAAVWIQTRRKVAKGAHFPGPWRVTPSRYLRNPRRSKGLNTP